MELGNSALTIPTVQLQLKRWRYDRGMAWNTAETQAKLKAAAVQEFAAHGLSGTRVERIAERAGVNKERPYKYFGSKEELFANVLSDELARIATAGPDRRR
jgi:AcrR family transcriptional regulator